MCLSLSKADCKAYLYATAAPVVSMTPVAWVVSQFGLRESKVFRGQIITAFHNSVNGTTVHDNEAVFCLKRKETDCLKLKSILKTNIFTGLTNQKI